MPSLVSFWAIEADYRSPGLARTSNHRADAAVKSARISLRMGGVQAVAVAGPTGDLGCFRPDLVQQ